MNFESTIFNGPAYFGSSAFNGTAYFGSSAFNGTADFRYSAFNGTANFGSSAFNGDAYFWSSAFNRTANFGSSAFNRTASFGSSAFNGDAYFWSSAFNESDFSFAQFNDVAYFEDARFNGTTSFNSSRFKGDALFEGADFNCTLYLSRARYDRLYIRWRDISELGYDDAAYLSLMETFKKLGYLEDYDNCYYEYRREHRDQSWSGKYHAINPAEELIRKRIDAGLEMTYGYGKRPLYPLYWSIGTILLFGSIWWIGGLGRNRKKNQESDFDHDTQNVSLKMKSPQSRNQQSRLYHLAEVMLFSATVFLSGTRLFVDPPEIPEIRNWSRFWTKAVFVAERILGAFFSILFFLAIGATVVR